MPERSVTGRARVPFGDSSVGRQCPSGSHSRPDYRSCGHSKGCPPPLALVCIQSIDCANRAQPQLHGFYLFGPFRAAIVSSNVLGHDGGADSAGAGGAPCPVWSGVFVQVDHTFMGRRP
jgi:hypothetical protein